MLFGHFKKFELTLFETFNFFNLELSDFITAYIIENTLLKI